MSLATTRRLRYAIAAVLFLATAIGQTVLIDQDVGPRAWIIVLTTPIAGFLFGLACGNAYALTFFAAPIIYGAIAQIGAGNTDTPPLQIAILLLAPIGICAAALGWGLAYLAARLSHRPPRHHVRDVLGPDT